MEELTLEEVEVFRVSAHEKPAALKIPKVQKPHSLLLLTVQSSSQDHEDLLQESRSTLQSLFSFLGR